jgi:hypothetical protein
MKYINLLPAKTDTKTVKQDPTTELLRDILISPNYDRRVICGFND